MIGFLNEADNYQKIILNMVESNDPNMDEDVDSTHYLMEKLFAKDNLPIFDIPLYNPFHKPILNLEREDVKFFLRPDAVRAGWPRHNIAITNLTVQERDQDQKTVYFDTLSPFLRRGLRSFFEDRKMGNGSIYGVFPRDFCQYCTSSRDALFYFSLVRSSFSMEESFFATLAIGHKFSHRVVRKQIMWTYSVYGSRLTAEMIKSNIANDLLFARKAPKSEYMSDFYTDIYQTLSVETTQLPEMDDGSIRTFKQISQMLFESIDLSDVVCEFGVLGQAYFYDITFCADGSLSYDLERQGQMGITWAVRENTLSIYDSAGAIYAQFDGLRVVGEKLVLFGNWLHLKSCTLALACNLRDILKIEKEQRSATPSGTNIVDKIEVTEGRWAYWFSSNHVLNVTFLRNGTAVTTKEDQPFSTNIWHVVDGRLVVFGLFDMPIAVFDIVISEEHQVQLSGVTWGRAVLIEPCFLQRH